jgi:hypothetical protein
MAELPICKDLKYLSINHPLMRLILNSERMLPSSALEESAVQSAACPSNHGFAAASRSLRSDAHALDNPCTTAPIAKHLLLAFRSKRSLMRRCETALVILS